jgi:hypothetical protein
MNSGTPPSPRAGGFLLAASILVGTAIGIALRQPTLGVLGGTALGLILALLLWLLDRRR